MNTRTNHGAIVPIERIELLPFTLPTPPPEMKWHHEDGWNDGGSHFKRKRAAAKAKARQSDQETLRL